MAAIEEHQRCQRLRLLLLLSAVFLGVGLVLPCMTMEPGFWGLENFLPIADPQSKSIISGIVHLFRSGDVFLAFILLAFSVVFPIWKLCVLYGAVYQIENHEKMSASVKFADKLGKFSMLDVIVMGMLVLSFQSFPGGSRANGHSSVFILGCTYFRFFVLKS
ncbi:paraquat-inducible protein A [Cerasicoccus fimbriatus]|uniref:paraquat-inducible protein A n=1 Tax=Cerasicoccus fimbriatus TaxID=3014554 RepID=UPI0022B4651B|nr:paraquat-inducible protein A [Cerasicoccus sp. TK19100]